MRAWPPDGWDVLAVVGIGALCYGLYLVMPALAFIVGGGLLMAIGVLGAATKGKVDNDRGPGRKENRGDRAAQG